MPDIHLTPLPSRTTKGELLQFVCSAGGIRGEQVGKINLGGASATIEVPLDCLARLVKALDGASFKNRRLRVTGLAGAVSVTEKTGHFQRLARLVELEAEAESHQTQVALQSLSSADAERAGTCLGGMVIVEEDSGLGGRCLLTLAKRNRQLKLPWTRLEPGTPVLLSPETSNAEDRWRAVVCERSELTIRIALHEPPQETERFASFRLDGSTDDVARQRLQSALERVRSAHRDRLAELRAILMGESPPSFAAETPFEPLDDTLNAAQQEAVRFALAAHDVAIVHGPPGTGKTTAIVELIRQAMRRGEKVLACAPSNLAVDNLLERLLAHGEKAVRLGHPARVLPALRAHTLDLLVEDHPDRRQARKLAKRAFALFRQAGKFTRAKPEPGARQAMRQEGRALLNDARELESIAVERIVSGAGVVCATLTGLDSEVLGQRQFDLAVVDEAGQSTEPACWLPLLRCRRLILAGDHCQLPPTVLSQEAVREGLGVSLMERLANTLGATVTRRLDVQYRMHHAIMEFPSQQFYEGSLRAHSSVRDHRLCDLPDVATGDLTATAVRFIDTAGAGYDEQLEEDGMSRLNLKEADLACGKVRELLKHNVPPEAIAVIAPYAAQVRIMRERLNVAGVEIDSVDGFQGREKEALIISCVRSNSEGDIGFLADIRRMNVAMTRARRLLLIIGDSATLSCHPFYQNLMDYLQGVQAYHSVWEESEIDAPRSG